MRPAALTVACLTALAILVIGAVRRRRRGQPLVPSLAEIGQAGLYAIGAGLLTYAIDPGCDSGVSGGGDGDAPEAKKVRRSRAKVATADVSPTGESAGPLPVPPPGGEAAPSSPRPRRARSPTAAAPDGETAEGAHSPTRARSPRSPRATSPSGASSRSSSPGRGSAPSGAPGEKVLALEVVSDMYQPMVLGQKPWEVRLSKGRFATWRKGDVIDVKEVKISTDGGRRVFTPTGATRRFLIAEEPKSFATFDEAFDAKRGGVAITETHPPGVPAGTAAQNYRTWYGKAWYDRPEASRPRVLLFRMVPQ